MTFKEIVLGMVARKELSAAQAMQLVQNGGSAAFAASKGAGPTRVAVIGMAGRFPGAANVEAFWRNLRGGVCSIGKVPVTRWDASRYFDAAAQGPGKTYCKWGGFLDGVDEFDAAFFGISPKEAAVMDPQQRLFLETAWHALEDAALSPRRLDGVACGVFVGAGAGDFAHAMAAEGIAADGYSFMGNANSILSARISYLLNLRGPALAVDTACSSSLVAVHLACESLALGTSEVAIAGGICVLNTPGFFLAGSNAGMLSRRGECRAFDRDADGLVPGEAVAAVVLKPLDRALADGDRIYGVIEASGVNQDGRTNGITAPSAPSQTALELAVYQKAGVTPELISYIEAHGTGTRLGDPIEIEALTTAFRKSTARTGFCGIGSSKTNVGHTMSASGVVGLIKTLLMLRHREIAPSLRFDRENEAIGFAKTPFFVPTELRPWESGGMRRAAVSSFGFSGTNVHMVVAEAPARVSAGAAGSRVFVLSAKTASALRRQAVELAEWLESSEAPLDAVAYTLLEGRAQFDHRATFVASDARELARKLRAGELADVEAGPWEGARPAPVSLPGYPFERRSYRLGEATKPRRVSGEHPLLDERTGSGYATAFTRELPFLRDHVVQGAHILPGACFVEMALAGSGRSCVGDVVFRAPLVVGESARRVELRVTGERFEIAGEVVHCTGRVVERAAGSASSIDLAELRARCSREVAVAEVVEAFRAAGVVCGPYCGGMARLWLGDGAALAELRLPAGESRSLGYYRLHPTLSDGAFQAAMALVGSADAVLVPYRVGSVECFGEMAERVYAFVERRSGFVFDVTLIDEEGRVVASLREFEARALTPPVEAVPMYRPVWVAAPAESVETVEGRALVLALDGSRAEAEAIAESRDALVALLGERSEPVAPGVVRVDAREVGAFFGSLKPVADVWFVGAGGDDEAVALLRVLKALQGPARLTVVTRGGRSGIGGMAVAFSREQSAIQVRVVDREHDGQVCVLERVEGRPGSGPTLRRGGVCVIVGGAGGLGLAFARHFVAKYDAKVLLIGRSELGATARRMVAELPGVVYERADVCDRDALDRALAGARERWGAIHGVIHAGMVLRDVPVAAMSEKALVEVLAPKIAGSRVLAEAAREDALDFLVFFSSANSFVGNAGQANYAAASVGQDAVAREVAAWGRWPVKLINWGLWGEVGAVATAQHRDNAARVGIGAMTTAEGIAAFEAALRSDEFQMMPMKVTASGLNALGIAARDASDVGDEFEAVERHGRELLRRWFADAGTVEVATRYRRLYAALQDVASRADGRVEAREWSEWARPFVKLLDVCLARYSDILTGHVSATDVLFPSGSMDLVAPLYRENPIVQHYNAIVAAAVVERVKAGARRIVEVGAGTGGTTAGVLEALGESAAVEYVFTDLSPTFVQQAKARFGARYPYVRFEVLDIDREPKLAPADVVVASNVLHATRRIDATARHVRQLLKPGGVLILNESTKLHDFSTLTFGLTDGWWLCEDPERRLPHSPLLDVARWRSVLRDAGFATVEGNEEGSQTVFVASAGGAVVETTRPGKVETVVAAQVAKCLNLPLSEIDVNRRFAEYGVDSILGGDLVRRVNEALGVNLPQTILFDYPSARQLAAHLKESAPAPAEVRPEPAKGTKIAVIGMSGRFPGAPDIATYWRNLREGKCSVGEAPAERREVGKWGGFLTDIDCFDPMFFSMSGAEAEFTDPQQRLFLQEAWRALEDAGLSDQRLDGRKCGVFVGVGAGDYVHAIAASGLGEAPYAFLGNGVSVLASRISYQLNLKGPAVAIDTACSSSAMAIHLACQSILAGECEMAIAGGVFISTTSGFHNMTGKLGMLSPTGQCRAFDDGADGFVPGEGVGAIVLRPLEAALRDGDPIHGVVVATGSNQDGHTNGITAPSSVSQAELETEVYARAGVNPETITYVEAHGTGTKLGDPIEVEGLRQAFRRGTSRTGFCAVGSVKTNIGHAGPAAGIAGAIKVLLAMRDRELPPSLHFDAPNRNIDFAGTPFYVNRELRAWRAEGPRRAALSSFGLSGTNVHLLFEEAPALPERAPETRRERAFVLSAKMPEALRERARELAEWLRGDGREARLDDVACTLAAGRTHFSERVTITATTREELIGKLEGPLTDGGAEWREEAEARRISMPAYPFARERYWLPVARPEQKVHYFRPVWERAELRAGAADGIVIPAQASLDAYFEVAAKAVRERQSRVAAVVPAGDLECIGAIARPLAALVPGLQWTTVIGGTVEQARAELAGGAAEVRYTSGAREVRTVAPFEPQAGTSPIRKGGVYWITGGNGALGRALARYLREQYSATVVLTSRSTGVDVTDVESMRAAAAEIRRAHGRTHGVFHAAGIIDSGLLHEKPAADIQKVLGPKITGAKVLDEVTKDDALDFFVLFSSLAAVVGDFGQCDYSVANRFLETFAEWRNRNRPGRTVAIHWPLWAEGGMHFSRDVEEQYLKAAGMEALETAAGWRALETSLAAGVDAIAVAAGDPERVRQLIGGPVKQEVRAEGLQPVVAAHVREVTARIVKLSAAKLPLDGCFSNFGLDSVHMKSLADALGAEYGVELSPTLFFQHQSAAAFARYLCDAHAEAVGAKHRNSGGAAPVVVTKAKKVAAVAPASGAPIAIIGMSGRFPQSVNLDEFWKHLENGDDLITPVPADRWATATPQWGGFIPDLDKFDAAFFHISPREAVFMDPQHRMFLETVWAAIEDAGYRASSLAGRKIGVYVGCQFNEYMGLIGDAGEAGAQAALGNTHTMLANRVSFLLDFRGPSEAIDTACSSALVALHRAAQSIRNGDCEMAIVGGVSAILSPETVALSNQLGMLSPDGRCKTFDKSANGYVKGEGVGAVLLKPLDRALADGDSIHAVIRGTGENHGGRANFLTAPNPDAQTELLLDAYTRAGVDVQTVSYIEAHGTGTELGDPIEVDALNRAFGKLGGAVEAPYCGLGSVKSNIGHLEPAAGIAGLLKVVLAMQHGRIPATLHVREVNPYLKLAGSPFYLATEAREWTASPKRAGVSSFGFGGSNAHAIVEEAPELPALAGSTVGIVPISARTQEALRTAVERLCGAVSRWNWNDVVFTLQNGREAMEQRLAVEASGPEELLGKLSRWLAGEDVPGVYRGTAGKALDELGLFDTPEDFADFVRVELGRGKLAKVARLWCAGADVEWGGSGRRVPLPTYPFARTRHWFERKTAPVVAAVPAPPVVIQAASGVLEKLTAIFADALYLSPDAIDIDANFADLGLDSILAVELAKKMSDEFGAAMKATRLYDYTTIRSLAEYLGGSAPAPVPEPASMPVPLPVASTARPASTKTAVIELLADALYLQPSEIDENATFTDLGLDSILAVEFAKKLQDRFGIDLRATRLYDHSTVRDLAEYVDSALGAPAPVATAPPPESSIKTGVIELLADALYLQPSEIDENATFTDLGLDSILAVEFAKKLQDHFGIDLRATRLYDHSTVRDLAEHVESMGAQPKVVEPPAPTPTAPPPPVDGIAIIGMSGRFPGARNLDEFWANLAGGVDSTTEVPADRWPIAQYYDATPGAPGKTYCRRGGFLDGIDQFDPLFFQISPQEAECMDPQQRLFLEQAWLAFEDAGYSESRLATLNCAVFAGASQGDYFRHVDPSSAAASQFTLGNTNAILASRIAYYLNLRGPAVSVDTACSSALVALHLACQALRAGECDVALAGGVSVMTTPTMYLLGSQGRMLSTDGRCKTFDESADGFAPSEGVGAVVLKPLAAALRDGDRVLAVIRGSGINQDGKTNGITAPSAQSQAALETAVYDRFGLDPATFTYVEAHGTGTVLGDPIEMDALTTAFRRHTGRKQFCAIGSVKSNIGHCLPAAGMAGLIKTVLAMRHSQIPPTLHCRRENGHIDFANSPFYVNRELQPWGVERGMPRRAAVSSFGFSGTNAHVVVEEAPAAVVRPVPDAVKLRTFCVSAKSAESLRRRVEDLERWLVEDGGQTALDDVAYTLNVRRTRFRQAIAIVASTRKELIEKLRQYRESGSATPASEADWSASGSGTLVSLPPYPFALRRCWVSAPAGLLEGAAEILRDHVVQGKPVLPAVAYLEMARAKAEAAELRNIVWKVPCEAESATPELAFVRRDRAFDFVRSGVTHASGEVGAAQGERPSGEVWETAGWQEFSADRLYAFFSALGLSYGPSFRRVEWVRVNGRRALGRLSPHAQLTGVLDSALQTIAGFALGDDTGGDPVLPFALERYRVYGAITGTCYSQVTADPERGRFDVRIVDESGRVLVLMEGLASRTRKHAPTTLLEFQPVWREAALADPKKPAAGTVVIFRGPEDLGLSTALAAAHPGATVLPIVLGSQYDASPAGQPVQVNCTSEVDFERALRHAPNLSRIYFLGVSARPELEPRAIDAFQETAVLALFRLARTVARQEMRPDLIVVSSRTHRVMQGDVIHAQGATLSGFARVLAGEFPGIGAALIDVDSTDAARGLAAEQPATGERALPEIAYREGRRYRRELDPAPAPSDRPVLRDRGVYVILGGMGGLGTLFARHLAATKRARLLLVGRSPLDDLRRQRLRDLEALGGEAAYYSADVADPEQMARVRNEAIARWGAVHGVIDAAFLLRDQSLLRMDEQRFREGLDPKVRGTAAALWTFRDDALDWFALFSSSISFTGSPGQSNYAAGSTFQDAIGLAWNAVGKWPVRVLNWGFWGETGAVASDQYRKRAAALGVASITEAEGIAAFGRALAGDAPQRIVLKMAAEAKPSKPARAASPPPESGLAYLRNVVSTVLKVEDHELDNDRPFEDYGVDSLVSINVITRLEEDLGPLSKTLLFEHDTISKLAAHLNGRVPKTAAPATAPTPSAALLKVRETGSAQPSFWVHSVVGEMNWAVRLAHHMGAEWPVYGFQADGRHTKLEDMAAAYLRSVRAIQPHGPYILGGLSFGGSVALEMARQLEEAGEKVSWLVLLDAYAPGSAALDSLMQFNWDGLLPQVIANSLIKQWNGSPFLEASTLPKNDPEAQIRAAARHVRAVCKIPQTEDEIAAMMAHSARLANLHAEIQRDYCARPVRNVENAVVFRNRFGFVGESNSLGLPQTAVNDQEADHGWTQWLPAPPLVCTVDADHFSLPLDPAIGVIGRKLADLFDRRQRVFEVVRSQVLRVLPDVSAESITLNVRLRDIGANSLDRVEVATCAMEQLQVDVPRTRLAQVDSLGALVDVLLAGLAEGSNGA